MSGGGSWFCPVAPSWKETRGNTGFGGAGRPGKVRAAGTVGMWARAVGFPVPRQRVFAPNSAAFRLLQKDISLQSSKKKGICGCGERCGSGYGAVVRTGFGAEGCRCGLGGCFFVAGTRAGQHLGYPKSAPRPPQKGCATGTPAHGAEIRSFGQGWACLGV